MVRLKQPARQSTSYARFLGLLPRPEVTKSYRQPDSSNNDSTGPSNVYTSDTVCAERRDGFDITRSQAVHLPFLPTTGAEVGTHGYSTVPVHSGWATTYLASRQKHLQLPGVFVAHLVGDASKADLYVSLASSNLALCRCKTAADSYAAGSHAVIMSLLTQVQFCSEWGRNRVDQHKDTTQPLQLIMPVYTTREVVLQAIIGILGGQIKLSLLDVEPILVLANSIRVSHASFLLRQST